MIDKHLAWQWRDIADRTSTSEDDWNRIFLEFAYKSGAESVVTTDNTVTLANALAEIERLKTELSNPYDPVGAWNKGFEEGARIERKRMMALELHDPVAYICYDAVMQEQFLLENDDMSDMDGFEITPLFTYDQLRTAISY